MAIYVEKAERVLTSIRVVCMAMAFAMPADAKPEYGTHRTGRQWSHGREVMSFVSPADVNDFIR